MSKKFAALLLAVLLLMGAHAVLAEGELNAEDITSSSNGKSVGRMTDGDVLNAWTSDDGEQYLEFFVSEESPAKGISILWNKEVTPWVMKVSADGDTWYDVGEYGRAEQVNEFVLLPGKGIRIRICTQEKMSISELSLVGDEDSYQAWEDRPAQAELMVVTTHPDDEQLFFGGCMPTYTANQQKDTVVVYMTNPSLERQREALNGLWSVGVRQYPVFIGLKDKYSTARAEAEEVWGRDHTIELVTEQIRKYKPQVIVTHDVNGEYGHGQHRLTSYAICQAVENAADPTFCPESAEKYGVWNVPKLYLHQYDTNPLTLDCQVPLDYFDGKTAFEMAKIGYDAHKSQHKYWFSVEVTGKYSIEKWGLYYTSVGLDEIGGDMFENITPEKVAAANQ